MKDTIKVKIKHMPVTSGTFDFLIKILEPVVGYESVISIPHMDVLIFNKDAEQLLKERLLEEWGYEWVKSINKIKFVY